MPHVSSHERNPTRETVEVRGSWLLRCWGSMHDRRVKGLLTAIVTFVAVCASASEARAQLVLQNDGFAGAGAAFENGFTTGQIGAASFVAPSEGRTLQSVRLLFGGASGTRTVTLHVWDDTAATDEPGTVLYAGERSDQFSFAATAWEILFDTFPFPASTVGELRAAIARGPVDPPNGDRTVAAALRRGLARAAEARHATIDALLSALA